MTRMKLKSVYFTERVIILNGVWIGRLPSGSEPRSHRFEFSVRQKMNDTLDSRRCARMLRAVGDPERLRIIQCLRGGARTVSEVAAELDTPIVKVSHHLRILRHAGLLQDEKRGRFVSYRLHPEVFQPGRSATVAGHIDLGCCRIEIPKR